MVNSENFCMKQYPEGLRSCNTALIASGKERWPSRQELADRHGLPTKTLAQWASKGTGPRCARIGRHVRYRFSEVIDWEAERVDDLRDAAGGGVTTRHVLRADGRCRQ